MFNPRANHLYAFFRLAVACCYALAEVIYQNDFTERAIDPSHHELVLGDTTA